MRFLVDEDLPRSTAGLFTRYGYEAIDVRDVGLRGAKDSQVASYAQREKLCLVTGDFDFADIRNYPPARYYGILVLNTPVNAPASAILNLLGDFFKEEGLVSELPGKLVIVQSGRIRVRTG